MKRNDFKKATSDFLKRMMSQWFNDKPFIKGLGISIIDANINKMDNLIELFENENGDIDVHGVINNISDINEPIKIDLTTISPLLPSRVLLITKDDFNDFLRYVDAEENR
jgi:hypothetical protein